MIVKIEKSIGSLDIHDNFRVSNKENTLFVYDNSHRLRELMEGMNKAYFVCEIVDGIIEIGDYHSSELDW